MSGQKRRFSDEERKIRAREALRRFQKKHRQRLNKIARENARRPEVRRRNQQWAENHRERMRELHRKFYKKHKDRRSEEQRKIRSTDEYKQMAKIVADERLSVPEERMKRMIYAARKRAESRKLGFDIDAFTGILEKPPKICECCGCVLIYKKDGHRKGGNNDSPSVDRIDNVFGYIVGNVAIVCRKCNWLKGSSTEADLIKILNYIRCFKTSLKAVA